MKLNKRLLSSLLCAVMLIGLVPTGVFAAKWVPTSETDGVGEYYEYTVNASDITPETTDALPVYNFTVPMFNDVGDIIAIKFNDVAPSDKNYSSYIKASEIDVKHDMDDYTFITSMISGGHPGATEISANLGEGYENYISLYMFLYDESVMSDLSYALKINDKLYKTEDYALVEITTPTEYKQTISWDIANHNAMFGTTLPEKMIDATTIIEASQIEFDKIDFQLYYKGNLIETYNLGELNTKPIEYSKTYSYTITYKLNADGSVTATAPAAWMPIPPEGKIQYNANGEYTTCSNKTYNDTDLVFSFTDTIIAENIRVTSISTNAHNLQTTLNVTNIPDILEYYKTSDINPDDVTNADKPEGGYENPGDQLIKPAPDYDISPSDKENETPTEDSKGETTTPDTEETPEEDSKGETTAPDTEETPEEDSEEETTIPDVEDESTESKEVELTEDNISVSKDDMAMFITDNATKDVVIKTPSGITFTFAKGTMKEVDGKDTYDFGITMSDDYSMQPDMGDITKDNFVTLIDFNYSGNLPAEAIIKIPVGADRTGQTLYYLQKVGTDYTLIQSVKVDEEGYITVKQDHCSTYVVATSDVSKDNALDVNNETTSAVEEESSSDIQKEKEKSPEKKSGPNNAIIYVIIAVVIVAIAGAVVFVVYKKKNTEQKNN